MALELFNKEFRGKVVTDNSGKKYKRLQDYPVEYPKMPEFDFIGLRPSEKLAEVLINEHEANRTLEFKNYYIILPEFLPKQTYKSSKKYSGGEYTSETTNLSNNTL